MPKKNLSKRTLNLKEQYLEAFKYLKETQFYIYFAIFLFVFFAFIGFFFASHFTFLDNLLANLVDKTEGLGWLGLFFFILQNNLATAFISFIFGFFLGVFPAINAIMNGLILGYVFNKVYAVSGFSEFWRILPHGIFELPAIFISLGLGMKFGMALFSRNPQELIKERFYKSINVFLFIVVPLLIIAAIIETSLIIFF